MSAIKTGAYILLGTFVLSVIVWSTWQIAQYQYKARCEVLMSADQKTSWLECDSQNVPPNETR